MYDAKNKSIMSDILLQACLDLEPFGSNYTPDSTFNLTSAPVLFHLEHDNTLYKEIEKGLESVNNVDYNKVIIIKDQSLS